MSTDEQLSELKDRISQMSNEELLKIVEVEYDDYRIEALTFAEEELGKRGIPFEKPAIEDDDEQTDSVAPPESYQPCGNCGGPVRAGFLFADKELTMFFSDTNEERFVHSLVCSACGDMRLVVDMHTDVED